VGIEDFLQRRAAAPLPRAGLLSALKTIADVKQQMIAALPGDLGDPMNDPDLEARVRLLDAASAKLGAVLHELDEIETREAELRRQYGL
jgi:hypothetical protein